MINNYFFSLFISVICSLVIGFFVGLILLGVRFIIEKNKNHQKYFKKRNNSSVYRLFNSFSNMELDEQIHFFSLVNGRKTVSVINCEVDGTYYFDGFSAKEDFETKLDIEEQRKDVI